MIEEQTKQLIEKISTAFDANQFTSFIEYIRFPYFKNLKMDSKIDFTFPVTVFVGINGSGKSSALHALYGAPKGKSTGTYWFSTNLDPIKDESGRKPTFIYSYKNSSGKLVEVVKTRVGTSKGADYWEPSRPIKKYGMEILPNGARNDAIDKEVIYLDFRSELSAFDKYFYFSNFQQSKILKSKQDVLRKYARHIKTTITENKSISTRSRKSFAPVILTQIEIEEICRILDKPYTECKIIQHNFYGVDGSTIYFKTSHLEYSEAFAGRGEYAVVQLVNKVMNAPKQSLIILDEPEVSLHPAAQEQLKRFLLEQSLKNKLQIIISTHSPKIVEFLPDKAIKLFFTKNNKFEILNGASYFQAFEQIGEQISKSHVKTIIVEDSLAKTLIEQILINMGGDYLLLFEVVYFPGGAEHALKSSSIYSQEKETNKFILLDGDKRKPHFDPNNFTIKELDDLNFLKIKLKESTGIDFSSMSFKIDGNKKGGHENQQKKVIQEYLNYQFNNIEYLPLNTPEEFLWDEKIALGILSNIKDNDIKFGGNYKENFRLFSMSLFNKDDGEHIEKSQLIFLTQFIKNKGVYYQHITNILMKFHN